MKRRTIGRTKAKFIKETQQATGLKNSESMVHKLEASELRYRRLFEAARDGILILDAATAQIVDVNPFLVEMLGYSKEELYGKKLWEVGTFRDIEVAKSAFKKLQSEHYIRYEDMPLEAKNGELISVEFVSNVYDVDNTSVIQCNIRDITEHKQAEDKLRESIGKYKELVDFLPQTVFEIDEKGNFVFVNRYALEISGYTQQDIDKGLSALQLFIPEDRNRVRKNIRRILAGERVTAIEYTAMRKDGSTFPVLAYSAPVIRGGKPAGLRGMIIDITERKQAEEALKASTEALAASEKRYRTIFESAAEGILVADIGTKQFKYANPAISRMLGYSQEELRGMAVSDIHPKDSLEHVLADFEAQAKGERTLSESLPCLRKDGAIMYADIKTARTLLDGTECNIGFFTDTTQRRLAEERRIQNIESLSKAMDATIRVLAMTVEIRDPYTSGHQQRVSSLATCMAKEMGFPEEQIEGIRVAGLVHDIGKLYVPSEILSKPGRLNEIEFSMIKIHPQAGYDILKVIEFPWPVAQIVLQHHERMDGSGYPGHLLGKDIILEARVLAVADVVEAMASHRPYRPALGVDKALEEISQKRGILYDSEVVDVCLKLFNEKGFKFNREI